MPGHPVIGDPETEGRHPLGPDQIEDLVAPVMERSMGPPSADDGFRPGDDLPNGPVVVGSDRIRMRVEELRVGRSKGEDVGHEDSPESHGDGPLLAPLDGRVVLLGIRRARVQENEGDGRLGLVPGPPEGVAVLETVGKDGPPVPGAGIRGGKGKAGEEERVWQSILF